MAKQCPELENLVPILAPKSDSSGELGDDGDEELGAADAERGLRRSLSLFDGISLLAGTIVGSGIFTSPGVVLLDAGSVGLGLTAWVAASFLALCSSLVYAELGAAIPKAGGNAEFLRVAFGDAWGFAFIWTRFFVNHNGGLAIIGITFARYFVAGVSEEALTPFGRFYGRQGCPVSLLCKILNFSEQFTGVNPLESDVDSDPVVKAVAIGGVAVLTIWNCFGVHVSAILQNVISAMKLLLVSVLAVAAVGFVWGNPRVLEENMHRPFEGSNFSGFGVSCVAALWAFAGWCNLAFMAEELKEPERNIPRGTVGGISIVMVIYLSLNVIYLCILPAAVVKTSAVVAIDATDAALGPWVGSFMSILVAISVFGSGNGVIIYGGRFLYAAARQGQIFKSIGALGAQSRAPYVAYLLQGIMCILVLLRSSNFVKLVNFLGGSSFFFYGLTAAAQMKLRRDLPDLHRPYSVAFYPYAPLIVICFCLYLIVSGLISQPLPTSFSLGFVISSFPVYYLFVRQS